MSELNKYIWLESLILVFSILILILGSLNRESLNIQTTYYFNDMIQNWQLGPIISIIESEASSCPIGFTSLINQKWPGFSSSCICRNFTFSNNFYGRVRRGVCRAKRDSLDFCKSYPGIKEVTYFKWEGKVLCAKREPYGYFNHSITSKSCPTETRSCGKVDSLNNSLCVSNKYDCPINNIKVVNSTEKIPLNYQSIKLNNNKMMIFTNKENEKGLIYYDFRISQGQPCSNPYYSNYINSTYVLDTFNKRDKCLEAISDSNFDQRFKILDSASNYTKILEDNGITSLIKSPYYQLNQTDYKTNLFGRSYIGLKDKCYKYFGGTDKSGKNIVDRLNLIQIKADKARSLTFKIMIVIVLSSLFNCFISLAYLLILWSNQFKYLENKFWNYIFKGIAGFLFFILFLLFIIQAANVNDVPDIYEELRGSRMTNCTDKYTNAALKSVHDSISSSRTILVFCILFCIGSGFCIGFIIYFIRKSGLDDNQGGQGDENNKLI